MDDKAQKERIAKYLARAGICSRRDAERLIDEGRVSVNGAVLTTPAVLVGEKDKVKVDGKPVGTASKTRLWLYHKPTGLVTSHRDEQGRATVFDSLPKNMPRVISVGRLDLNSEGLLLLTNDGALARQFELPSTALPRRYRVRVHGRVHEQDLADLARGITVGGVRYGSIEAQLERKTSGTNAWVDMTLFEGKNREIRKVMSYLGLEVSRLIRVAYGPFELGELEREDVLEVPEKAFKKFLP